MPLTLAKQGEQNKICRIGGSTEVRRRLADMGFAAGGTVTVIACMGGDLIVSVREARVAISREMACKIMI